MKKAIIILSAVLLSLAVSCTNAEPVVDPTVKVSGITLDKTSCEVQVGAVIQLTATVSPTDATQTLVGWISTDESVAVVDNQGLVSAIAPGSATIKAVSVDGAMVASCAVNVTFDPTSNQTGDIEPFN